MLPVVSQVGDRPPRQNADDGLEEEGNFVMPAGHPGEDAGDFAFGNENQAFDWLANDDIRIDDIGAHGGNIAIPNIEAIDPNENHRPLSARNSRQASPSRIESSTPRR